MISFTFEIYCHGGVQGQVKGLPGHVEGSEGGVITCSVLLLRGNVSGNAFPPGILTFTHCHFYIGNL